MNSMGTSLVGGTASVVLRRREGPAVDELDAVAVGVGDEADPVLLAPAGAVGGLLWLVARLREVREEPVEVVDGQRDVAVAVAQVVGLVLADVDRELERVAVTRHAHVDVVGTPEIELAAAPEPERLVEVQRGVDVPHPHARVDQLERTRHSARAYVMASVRRYAPWHPKGTRRDR